MRKFEINAYSFEQAKEMAISLYGLTIVKNVTPSFKKLDPKDFDAFAQEMLEKNKKGEVAVRTAHSLNPVPFIIYDKETKYVIKDGNYGLANVAPTIVKMFGLEAPDCWEASMV